MKRRETPREFFPCQNCKQAVYADQREHIWRHAQSGKRECEFVAVPDLTVAAESGFAIR